MQWDDLDDVPEYFEPPASNWEGTYCELDDFELVLGNDFKRVCKIDATRYHADGRVMQTFQAIFTVVNVDGDWRLTLRNPVNIVPA